MNYYKVDAEKKIITINDELKATTRDEKDIAMYVSAGYIIKHKSQKRSKQASERAKANNLDNTAILEGLKDDEEGLAKYKSIKTKKGKGGGYFAAKSWYMKEYLPKHSEKKAK